jgi:hypothetical protein
MSKKWMFLLLLWCTVASYLAPERLSGETWVISADLQTASVSGRTEQPIWNKLNPMWWFLKDDEPDPPD